MGRKAQPEQGPPGHAVPEARAVLTQPQGRPPASTPTRGPLFFALLSCWLKQTVNILSIIMSTSGISFLSEEFIR